MTEGTPDAKRRAPLACRCELAERLAEALKPMAKENQKAGLETSSKRGGKVHPILGEPIECLKQAAKEAGVSHGSLAAFKSKGWTQERIGEVLGMAQQTLSRWLDIPNTRSGNASTLKDCRIKLSTLPTPPARYDAPTASHGMRHSHPRYAPGSVSRFSWDDMGRAGCRAA